MRRKLKKEASVEGKKARVARRVKRKGRNSNSDPAHNVKNHITPDGAAPLGSQRDHTTIRKEGNPESYIYIYIY